MIELYEPIGEISQEEFYSKNKEKLSQEGLLVVEGVVRFSKAGEIVDLPALVAKDGMIVPLDWDALLERATLQDPGMEVNFIAHEKKHLVFFDMQTQGLIANLPGVQHRQEFIEMITDLVKQMQMEHLLKDMKEGEFVELVNMFATALQEQELAQDSGSRPKP